MSLGAALGAGFYVAGSLDFWISGFLEFWIPPPPPPKKWRKGGARGVAC